MGVSVSTFEEYLPEPFLNTTLLLSSGGADDATIVAKAWQTTLYAPFLTFRFFGRNLSVPPPVDFDFHLRLSGPACAHGTVGHHERRFQVRYSEAVLAVRPAPRARCACGAHRDTALPAEEQHPERHRWTTTG